MSASSTTVDPNLQELLDTAASRSVQFEERLFELLRIPSVSTQNEHDDDCRAAGMWLASDLERIGMENVHMFETSEHPIVYGDWLHAGDSAPTVLIYGHYDVQPPDPLDEWNTPPFEPTLSADGVSVHARGAADDKGQLYVHIAAVETLLAERGSLPVNVKFILEGDEESGSGPLEPFIESHKELLEADLCVISDTHMLSVDQPSLILSLRGMSYCEITVTGPSHDLHSGTFGGAVRNPAEALANIIAALKDSSGHITVPGFYDDVVELTAADREASLAVGFNDEAFRRDAGISATFGEDGYTIYEQIGARPTLEVNGVWGGYTGEGAKTVLPSQAHAKISMRLVANQRWKTIGDLFANHVKQLAPQEVSVEVKLLHGGEPSLVDPATPALGAAAAALTQVFGVAPVYTREGGSIPVVGVVDRLLGIPTILMGFGLPDDRLHSPNEKYSLDQFRRGIATSILFWHELA